MGVLLRLGHWADWAITLGATAGGLLEDRGRGADLVTRTTVSGHKYHQLSPELWRGVVRLQLRSIISSWLLHSCGVVVE